MSLITDLSERFRALFRRARADRELDEEVTFHLDRDIADRIARGADPREARRQALIAIGGVDQLKEAVREARGIQPLEDLAADVRLAVRALGASPVFTLTVNSGRRSPRRASRVRRPLRVPSGSSWPRTAASSSGAR